MRGGLPIVFFVGGLTGLIWAASVAAQAAGTSEPDRPVGHETEAGERSEIRQGITGRVASQSGSPVADALVTAESLDIPSKAVPDIAILTNADGVFVWPLRPGTYRIIVVVAGEEMAVATAAVKLNELTRLDMKLVR